jgi:hypothetical protein
VFFEAGDKSALDVVPVGHFAKRLALVEVDEVLIQNLVLDWIGRVGTQNIREGGFVVLLNDELANLMGP